MNNKYKIVTVNFADANFEQTRKICTKTAYTNGNSDKVIEYSPEMIDSEFSNKNAHILSFKRGAGLWIWKPYFIKRTLETMKDNDYLFYCDAGNIFINGINLIIDSVANSSQDIFPFKLPLLEHEWSKNETQTAILGHMPKRMDNQYLATYILIRNSEFSRQFVNEWLTLMENPICSYPENITGEKNEANFIEHREDQSVFSLLCKKYNLKAYRDPSQYGIRPYEYAWRKSYINQWKRYSFQKPQFLGSNYPQIVISVRSEDTDKKCKKERIIEILRKLGIYNMTTFKIKYNAFYKCI